MSSHTNLTNQGGRTKDAMLGRLIFGCDVNLRPETLTLVPLPEHQERVADVGPPRVGFVGGA